MRPHARLAVLTLALAGCSGSTSPKAMSQADAQEMYAALSTVAASVGLETTAGGRVAAATFSQTAACPAGGSVSAQGSTTSTSTATTSDITATYNACKASAPGASRTWTMDGSIAMHAVQQLTGELAATIKGTVAASTSGVSASCVLDVSINTTVSGAVTVTGTVCGHSAAGE